MNYFLKYLSTAPIVLTLWLSLTSLLIIFLNYLYPEYLLFNN